MSIEVQKLSFAYAHHRVLENVSFQADAGQLIAVMGTNGVGKTTLFRCILGLQKSYQGQILVDGQNIAQLPTRSLAHLIAHIPQIHSQSFGYCVKDMVIMGTAHRVSYFGVPGSDSQTAAQQAMEKMGITHLADRSYDHLSGGEQQLVLIARALAQQTKNLLMDEPTASLDYGNQTKVLAQARRLADEGYTVLLSTHNPQHAIWYADRVLALHQGTCAAYGAPEKVLTPELIERLYGIQTRFYPTESGVLIAPIT